MDSRNRTAAGLILLGLIVLLPLAAGFARAFIGEDGAATLANISGVWGDGLSWRLLWRGLVLSALASGLAVLAGVPYAYLASSTDLPGRGMWEVAGIAGIVIPSYTVVMSWLNLLGDAGWVRMFLAEGMGLRRAGPGALAYLGVAWVLAASFVPFVVLFSAAAFRMAGEDASEAARADGATGLQVFARIRLPSAMSGVILGAGAVFAMSLGDYEIPAALGIDTASWEVVGLWTNGRQGAATAMAIGPTLILVGLFALYAVSCGGRLTEALYSHRGAARPERLGHARWPAVVYCSLFIALTVGVPLAGLVAGVGSLAAFARNAAAVTRYLATTLVASGGAAILATALGLAAGMLIARSGRIARGSAAFLSALPMAVPGAMLGLGLLAILGTPGLYELAGSNAAGLALGAALRFLPFGVFAGVLAAGSVPPEIEDAARVDGAGPAGVVVKVVLPLALPAAVGGLLIVFALSLCELQVTHILCPPGRATLAEHLYDRLHTGEVERVCTSALLMLACAAASGAAGVAVLRRGGRG